VAATEPSEILLKAMLAIMIDERESRPPEQRKRRTELVLAEAGLGPAEIAELTGKQPAAVRMALSRARRAGREPGGD
jgi:DNA-directed RNA polymerase specialized sigma24 family protein